MYTSQLSPIMLEDAQTFYLVHAPHVQGLYLYIIWPNILLGGQPTIHFKYSWGSLRWQQSKSSSSSSGDSSDMALPSAAMADRYIVCVYIYMILIRCTLDDPYVIHVFIKKRASTCSRHAHVFLKGFFCLFVSERWIKFQCTDVR